MLHNSTNWSEWYNRTVLSCVSFHSFCGVVEWICMGKWCFHWFVSDYNSWNTNLQFGLSRTIKTHRFSMETRLLLILTRQCYSNRRPYKIFPQTWYMVNGMPHWAPQKYIDIHTMFIVGMHQKAFHLFSHWTLKQHFRQNKIILQTMMWPELLYGFVVRHHSWDWLLSHYFLVIIIFFIVVVGVVVILLFLLLLLQWMAANDAEL